MSTSWLDRVRRNHALEHATINVLARKYRNFSAQGNSTFGGFHLNLYADIGDEEVEAAVMEAYDRLKNGEARLALHPNCGTVLLTTAVMATLAAQATLSIERRRNRAVVLDIATIIAAIPTTILAVFVALLVSRPVGMSIQAKYTVDPNLGDLEVISVGRVPPSATTRIFQLLLGQAKNQDVNSFMVKTRG